MGFAPYTKRAAGRGRRRRICKILFIESRLCGAAGLRPGIPVEWITRETNWQLLTKMPCAPLQKVCGNKAWSLSPSATCSVSEPGP